MENILEKLKKGNERFIKGVSINPNQSLDRCKETSKGQNPFAVVLTCSDSRTPPEIIFDAGIGDLFVIRLAGNVLTNEAIASIEYATAHLGVEQVIILGHTNCGAVKAAVETNMSQQGTNLSEYLKTLVDKIDPNLIIEGKDVDKSVVKSTDNLIATSASELKNILNKLIVNNSINVTGAKYNIETGEVVFLG